MSTTLEVYMEPCISAVKLLYKNGNTSIENILSSMDGRIGQYHVDILAESDLITKNNGGYEISTRGKIVLRNILSMRNVGGKLPEKDKIILEELNEFTRG